MVELVAKRTSLSIEDVKDIKGLKIIRPKLFPDDRGFFMETYNAKEFEALGFTEKFLQDNHSFSKCGVLRGIHAQPGMGKLVSVVAGEIYDVAVDIRPESETYGKWHGEILNGKTRTAFWIPDGFLHGFYVLSKEGAHVTYKCTAVYDPSTEFGVNALDKDLNIDWHIEPQIGLTISERDRCHKDFRELNLRSGAESA